MLTCLAIYQQKAVQYFPVFAHADRSGSLAALSSQVHTSGPTLTSPPGTCMLPMLTPSMESFRPYGPSPLFGSDHEWDATQQALRVTVFGYGSPFSGS